MPTVAGLYWRDKPVFSNQHGAATAAAAPRARARDDIQHAVPAAKTRRSNAAVLGANAAGSPKRAVTCQVTPYLSYPLSEESSIWPLYFGDERCRLRTIVQVRVPADSM